MAHVLIDKDGSVRLKTPNGEQTVTLQELAWRRQLAIRPARGQRRHDQADKGLPYETVVKAMGELQSRRQARGPRRQVRRRQVTFGPAATFRPPARNY
jgi:biopolymer transport protein ExbD